MNLRSADVGDIGALVLIRLDFFREMFPPRSPEDLEALANTLRRYYGRHLRVDFWAVLAEDNGRPIGAAFLNIYERPANPEVPNGRVGELSNVYTHPQYRSRGLARVMVGQLIKMAEEQGVSRLDLSASEAGRPVYEKLGFEADPGHTRMHLRLGAENITINIH